MRDHVVIMRYVRHGDHDGRGDRDGRELCVTRRDVPNLACPLD